MLSRENKGGLKKEIVKKLTNSKKWKDRKKKPHKSIYLIPL